MTQNVDFTVTGHLPPSQKKKKLKKEKSRLSKTDSVIRRSFSARPSSVPVSSQWDENNPLSIQSVSIPLSSRGKHSHLYPKHHQSTHKPIRHTRLFNNKRLSSSSTSSLSSSSLIDTRGHQTDRPHYSSSNSAHPPAPFPLSRGYDEQLRSRNNIPLLDSSNESIPEILDESVSKLSSEIDSILHDINEGLIIGSPPNSKHESSEHVRRQNESVVLQKAEEYIQSNNDPHRNMPTFHNEYNQHSVTTEDRAAVKIQEWFREQRNKKLEKKLSEVDSSIKRRASAAVIIQRWFRRKQHHKQQSQLKGLLQEKRNEMEKNRQASIKEPTSTVDKEQRRALKMQAARKQAIEVLKKKREEEKKEKELIIQQEMAMLEQTGVIKRSRSATKGNSKRKLKVAANFDLTKVTSQPELHSQSTTHHTAVTPHSHSDPKLCSSPDAINTQCDEPRCDDTNQSKGTEVSSPTGSNVVDVFFKGGPRKTTPKRQLSPCKNPDPINSTTTVNDIFATLKELEQDPPPLPGATPTSPPGYLSKTNLELFQRSTSHVSDQKLQNILTYLDDIQKTDPTTSSRGGNVSAPNTIHNEDISQQLQAASDVANDVTTTIVTQRMELENKNKTIEMLQKALNQQRELTVYHAQEMEKESQKRLDLQKQEYEGTISRHQCFIDQLIDDKKTLSDNCEALVKEVKEMDKKHKTRTTTMENIHVAEMEKLKQTTVAAEKMRREKWRAEETQRIKEATVKSLEPEIQRIIARGKAEIQKLKAMHEAELLQADERASRRFVQQTEELRVQCAQEKEKACQHERELARQKYEQLAEQEEQSNQQLRRKLYSEIQVEKDKLAFESTHLRENISKQLKELKDSHELELSKLKAEHETSTAETQRRHMNELRDVKERLAIEKQAWEENYIRKQDAVLLTKEREMRDRLRRERDMEIETVIRRLEAETATAREECERTSESRVKRIREKYETELKEVEKSERQTLEKYNTMKSQLTEYEGDIIRLRSQLRMREEEVERVNEIATRLTKERDRVADVVRQEFVDRLIALEDENRHLKLEINELKSRHSLELSRKEREKERELEEVHQRVKEALTKKEDNYRGLRSQHEAALKRADHLEMLLEQQRKQLLKR